MLSLPNSINSKNLLVFVTIGITMLFIVYIWQITAMAILRASENNLNKKLEELTLQNKKLEIELSRTDALTNLQNKLSALSFESVNKVQYLKLLESVVVKSSYGGQ